MRNYFQDQSNGTGSGGSAPSKNYEGNNTMKTELTGYPSIDKPWLKYYSDGAREASLEYPKNKILWDVIEEKLIEHREVIAIEYMGRNISREELIDEVYTWAKSLKALGVKENEIVPIYSIRRRDVRGRKGFSDGRNG